MHGQPRRPKKPEDGAAAVAKAAKLRDLQAQVLHNHHTSTYTEEALGLSFKLLEINPEAYTAWNYRKLALRHNLKEPEAIKSVVDDELRVVEAALRANLKSYGAWYHRKWLLNQKLTPVDSKREFGLLDKLLKLDARNFHTTAGSLQNLWGCQKRMSLSTQWLRSVTTSVITWHGIIAGT
ncbi:hypothetical protein ACQ4PT_058930 [Festuca glaucescens]